MPATDRYDEKDVPNAEGYLLKSWNIGLNWTWTKLPPHLAGAQVFQVDPTDNSTLYAATGNCLARSYDNGDTWDACSNASGLEGNFIFMEIKDSTTMFLGRMGDVPLRTKDGGKSWQPLASCSAVGPKVTWAWAAYSWSGKTLALGGRGGIMSAKHPHAVFVWISTDDGDSWTDETGDLVVMGAGLGQWFENVLYLDSFGQGILRKTLE